MNRLLPRLFVALTPSNITCWYMPRAPLARNCVPELTTPAVRLPRLVKFRPLSGRLPIVSAVTVLAVTPLCVSMS